MIVFPAIDLKGGQVVRLAEGDMDRATVYGDEPAAQALLFAEAGAEHLHVVDLDGSFAGKTENRAAVEAIIEAFPGYVQLGGGIRTPEAVADWFDLGVARANCWSPRWMAMVRSGAMISGSPGRLRMRFRCRLSPAAASASCSIWSKGSQKDMPALSSPPRSSILVHIP